MATFVPTEVGVHDVFVAARGSPDGSDESQEGALIEKSYQTRICNAKVNNIIQVWREFNPNYTFSACSGLQYQCIGCHDKAHSNVFNALSRIGKQTDHSHPLLFG